MARPATAIVTSGEAEPPFGARPAPRSRSALQMIADCFRHQHPEAFGLAPVPGAIVPAEVRYGRDDIRPSAPADVLSEEPMGDPRAISLEHSAHGVATPGGGS